MEWSGRTVDQPIPAGVGSEFQGNSTLYESYNSWQGSSNAFQESCHNPSQGHFANHQSFNTSCYVEDPQMSHQTQATQHVAAPRVHINPNFRPKPTLDLKNHPSVSRGARVHINPHWKGRIDSVANISSDPIRSHEQSSNSISQGKKTIFVNPKVLAHLKMESSAPLDVESSLLYHKTCPTSEGFQDPASTIPFIAEETGPNRLGNIIPDKKNEETEKNYLSPNNTFEPAYVVLSSTKLVRRSDQKSSSTNDATIQRSELNCAARVQRGESCKRNPRISSYKMAKQVASKYRLVRNSSFVPSSTKGSRAISASSPRGVRRKSFTSKLTSTPKSMYKFVRKTGLEESSTKPSHPPHEKKLMNSVLYADKSQNITKNNNDGSNTKKNVRTRFKLVKMPPQLGAQASPVESNKHKTIRSRFKLVRNGSLDGKFAGKKCLPVKKHYPSGPIFPTYLQNAKSHFKTLRTARGGTIIHGRKVTRFRITSNLNTSKQKIKALQGLVKLRKNPDDPILFDHRIRRWGRFANISWKKDKTPFASQYLYRQISSSTLSQLVKKQRLSSLSDNLSKRSLLNIRGVLYHSTRTSLTRTQQGKAKEQVLFIRGERFVLDTDRITLRPTSDRNGSSHVKGVMKSGPPISRVDIGGVTFTRRGDNTLVRTNTHHARTVVNIAKMRSIALLRNKLHKNNQPCLIYHRFGKCHSHQEGKCWRVHDPKNIAICRKFLQGNCEAVECPLSHNVGPEKMPTCRYFLEGCCVRDNCPYLHVKLSACAAICREFLHGYCAAGDMCKKRHVYMCPDFERHGKCSKGKYCPYPHKTASKVNIKSQMKNRAVEGFNIKVKKAFKEIGKAAQDPSAGETEKRKRYYDESASEEGLCKIETVASSTEDLNLEPSEQDVSDERCDIRQENYIAQIRPKIGDLPAYIPLE